MKPDDVSWHDYLKDHARLRWRRPGDEQRFHELCGLMQPLYALFSGKLLDGRGPKRIVAFPTPRVVRDAGHSPWTFRFQCSTTGRLSTAIPYERFTEFGILTEDATTGGPFPRGKQSVDDRFTPRLHRLQAALRDVLPSWDFPGIPWHERYDEYLRSDDWLARREQVLHRDNYRCRYTGKSKRPGDPLQVHHLTYERVGCEHLDDLVTICRSAHQRLHEQPAHA